MPFPSPGDLPDPGTEPRSLTSPALAGRFFTSEPPGSEAMPKVSSVVGLLLSKLSGSECLQSEVNSAFVIVVGTAQCHHPLPPPVILNRSSRVFDTEFVQKSNIA